MEEIRVLQLGKENWNSIYTLPQWVNLEYVECFEVVPKKFYDLVFFDRTPYEEELEPLYQAIKAYTLFITKNVEISGKVAWLCCSKKAQHISAGEIQRFLLEETRYYYPKPYGDKVHMTDIAIAQGFSGKVRWDGNFGVTLEGEFGDEFRQVAYWRYDIFLYEKRTMDIWLEYSKDSTVSISMEVTQFVNSTSVEVARQWIFDEADLEQVAQIESENGDAPAFISICAKGRGKLKITALHKRISRGSHGFFLPGGERYVTSEREELFCYFDPRDMKPPLNVFFAGWEVIERFLGYNMNRKLECPFLLLLERRLTGGCFYRGSEEYEEMVRTVIRKYMNELGFSSDQVILSGGSMGAYASMYYGCDIKPHAIVLMKPLAGIGNIAMNEKYVRPMGYASSLDILRCVGGDMDEDTAKLVNDQFWNKFDGADWGKSKFIVAYMIEDDFEGNVYTSMISHLRSCGVQVYGKGFHGRHSDGGEAIVHWFSIQLTKMLNNDFPERKCE